MSPTFRVIAIHATFKALVVPVVEAPEAGAGEAEAMEHDTDTEIDMDTDTEEDMEEGV